MKNFKYILFLLLGVGILTTSCDDDFSEEDLLDQQAKLAAEAQAQADEKAQSAKDAAVEALNAAGNLLDYTVTVLTDNQPVEGVSVSINNQTGESTTVTTDANGMAVFTDIRLGGHTVSVSSPDHLDVSYLVDFGKAEEGVHYQVIDGNVVPIEISEASKISLFALSGLQTATIKGRAKIETDLTNNASEVPQDITLRVNLDASGLEGEHSRSENQSAGGNSIYIPGSFKFTEGDIGSAVVDNTTGEYTITVPASDEGTDVDIIYPLIETDQTLVFSMVNDEFVGVQAGTQLARFGVDFSTAEATPNYDGAIAEFPAPADPGRGFTLTNFQRFNRSVFLGSTQFDNTYFNYNNMKIRINPGEGYQSTPTVTMSAPDLAAGQATDFTVDMEWNFEQIAFTNEGSGYAEGEAVNVTVELYEGAAFVNSVYIGTVYAEADGTLPSVLLPADMSTTEYTYRGTSLVNNFEISLDNVKGGAAADVTVNGIIDEIEPTNASFGYSSIPTITISGGSPSTPATMVIEEMAFAYTFDLDNSGITQDYVELPEISFEYEDAPGSTDDATGVRLITLDADGFESADLDLGASLENYLMVSGSDLAYDEELYLGTLGAVDAGITSFMSYSTPKVVVIEPEHEQASANVTFNADGEVTGLTDVNVGSGYTSEFGVTITTLTGLSGSGAEVLLIDFSTNSKTGEVTWSGTSGVVSPGESYVGNDEANIDAVDFAGTTSLTVKNGQTYFNDINYGTGERVEDVE